MGGVVNILQTIKQFFLDNLKKHIKKNRAELDRIESPDMEKIWGSIQSEIKKDITFFKKNNTQVKKSYYEFVFKKEKKQFSLWGLAAAASVALLIGLGMGYLIKTETPTAAREFNLADYAPELKQEEEVYRQLVSQKMLELDVEHLDKEDFADVLDELNQLDEEYTNWTKDVPQYVHQQELLEFLTRHYEQKIRILEILSKEIEKKSYYEKRL